MSGDFHVEPDLGGGFNVTDIWGNFKGKFIPAGGGGGCWGVLALIIFGLIAFVIYLMIMMVIEGFKALGKKKWGRAVAFLGIASAPCLLLTMCLAGRVVTAMALGAVQAQEDADRLAQSDEITWAIQNPTLAFSIERVEGGFPASQFPGCYASEYHSCDDLGDFTWGEYRVTNLLNLASIYVEGTSTESASYCEQSWTQPVSATLLPGESVVTNCIERGPYFGVPCLLISDFHWGRDIAQLCLDGGAGVFK